MKTRIAIVGEYDPNVPNHVQIEQARGSMLPAAGTKWFSSVGLTPAMLDDEDINAVWLASGIPFADRGAVTDVMAWAQSEQIPVGWDEPGDPDTAIVMMVGAARHHSEAIEVSGLRARLGKLVQLPFVHLMRGPAMRWWRPLLSMVLLALLLIAVAGAVTVPFALFTDATADAVTTDPTNPAEFLWLNLLLASLIPASVLALWIAFRRSPGLSASVDGRMRWGWLAASFAVLVPVWAIFLGVMYVLDPPTGERPTQWIALLAIFALTTPLQAAGEEFLFRGWLPQTLGAWIPSPGVAFVVTSLLSSFLFALAHGSLDPWVMIQLAGFGLAASFLAWRTGGLEAPIALHAATNLWILGYETVFGDLASSLVDETTTGTASDTALAIGLLLVETTVVLVLARMRGISGDDGALSPALSPPPSDPR